MLNDLLQDRFNEIEQLALAAGLQHYDVQFFEVPSDVICHVASYGLPTRFKHWSFGQIYKHQKEQQEMGFSKIYELILNSNPSLAYLDSSNSDTTNLLICAHCFGHSSFFANNILFNICNETNMVQIAKKHAEIIDEYRKEHGDDEVDDWIDIAMSLERHIDIHKGLYRKPYPKRHIEHKERTKKPYEDIAGVSTPLVEKVLKGIYLPPNPEKDILWFFANYANLDGWQKHIFDIIRRESFYFYPQMRTKISNEGFASYWHAELMYQYALGNDNEYGVTGIKHPLSSEEHLDIFEKHEKVVQPGFKMKLKVDVQDQNSKQKKKAWNPLISQRPELFNHAIRYNPYYVGFTIYRDIKERWDKYYKQGYMETNNGEQVEVLINGHQKVLEVMREEDDVSLLRKYLTQELCEKLHLFRMGNNHGYNDNYEIQEEESEMQDIFEEEDKQLINNKVIIVKSKDKDQIIESLSNALNNYGVPNVVIRRVDENGLLRLEHLESDSINIDIGYAKNVLAYLYKIWNRPIELIRKDSKKKKTWVLLFDGEFFETDFENIDYPENIESNERPSSW